MFAAPTPNKDSVSSCPFHRALVPPKRIDALSVAPDSSTVARCLETTLHYLRGFVSQPHPHLGREGEVCPFMRKALEKSLVLLTPYSGPLELAPICRRLEELQAEYRAMEPREGADRIYRAIVLVFPELPESQLGLIDAAQSALKAQFVQDGLMVGQFHHRCAEGGVHNPNFRPLRSPYPMLAIRQMTGGDIVFLDSHPTHFKRYLRTIGEAPAKFRARFDAALGRFGYPSSSSPIDMRVFEALQRAEVDYRVVSHSNLGEDVSTPLRVAAHVGCCPDAVAKSVVLRSESAGALVMAVVPATRRIDLTTARELLRLPDLRVAEPVEAKAFAGQPLGGISPIGHERMLVLIDEMLTREKEIFVGTGNLQQDLGIAPSDLVRLTNARVESFV